MSILGHTGEAQGLETQGNHKGLALPASPSERACSVHTAREGRSCSDFQGSVSMAESDTVPRWSGKNQIYYVVKSGKTQENFHTSPQYFGVYLII